MSDKIQPVHRERAACVYVRQSTMTQVRNNTESRRRQYALAERAKTLGFKEVRVIDDDLGRSGSGAQERPGFAKLVAMVCAGEPTQPRANLNRESKTRVRRVIVRTDPTGSCRDRQSKT